MSTTPPPLSDKRATLPSSQEYARDIRGFLGAPPRPKSDPVNSPAHYTKGPTHERCGELIECIDVTEELGFNLGNTVKYVWRCDAKGSAVQDLEKARWYLDREIQRRKLSKARAEERKVAEWEELVAYYSKGGTSHLVTYAKDGPRSPLRKVWDRLRGGN